MAEAILTVVGDEMEAEALCGLLRVNGVECSYRRSDVSAAIAATSGGFTIAGPIEVIVEESDVDAARKLLPEQ